MPSGVHVKEGQFITRSGLLVLKCEQAPLWNLEDSFASWIFRQAMNLSLLGAYGSSDRFEQVVLAAFQEDSSRQLSLFQPLSVPYDALVEVASATI